MIGGAILGLADALIEWGSEIEAKLHEELAEKGKVLVIVHGDEKVVAQAENLFKATEAEEVEVH